MLLAGDDGNGGGMSYLVHENDGDERAFVVCDRGMDEEWGGGRDLYAEACPGGGEGRYGRGKLWVRYLE